MITRAASEQIQQSCWHAGGDIFWAQRALGGRRRCPCALLQRQGSFVGRKNEHSLMSALPEPKKSRREAEAFFLTSSSYMPRMCASSPSTCAVIGPRSSMSCCSRWSRTNLVLVGVVYTCHTYGHNEGGEERTHDETLRFEEKTSPINGRQCSVRRLDSQTKQYPTHPPTHSLTRPHLFSGPLPINNST